MAEAEKGSGVAAGAGAAVQAAGAGAGQDGRRAAVDASSATTREQADAAREAQHGEELLRVEHLVTEFPTRRGVVRAVSDVSFQVRRGEIVAIVGESGSGKSVTSLSIMRLLQKPGHVASGSITFDGRDLLALSERQMQQVRGKDIAMIFQEPMTSLNPVYRVGDQIVEAIRTHDKKISEKDAMARAVEMLRVVGIPSPAERARDFPHQMSGGMRQRVMIAMALSCNPQLLIADEPTTALDVTIQAQILDLLYKLRNEYGMAVMLITHDLGVVSEIAERVVVMYCGQAVEESDKFGLFDRPMHPYTLGLLRSIPRLEDDEGGHLYMIRGMVPNLLNMPPGCPFSDRCARACERCTREAPELYDIPGHPGRQVRCFLYENGANADADAETAAWSEGTLGTGAPAGAGAGKEAQANG